MKYEVRVDGQSVWSKKTKSGVFDRETFPAEYRGRPEIGSTTEITLLTDGNVIAVQRAEDAATPVVIVGTGAVTESVATADNQ